MPILRIPKIPIYVINTYMGIRIPKGLAQPLFLVPTPLWAAWVQTEQTGYMRSTRTHARLTPMSIHIRINP